MKIVAVVPIKLNSTRLPKKNIKAFTDGKPLCTYILNTLLSTEAINATYVYCSNTDIRSYLPDGAWFLKRSEALDGDNVSMTDVLKSFSDAIDADVYVMTHVTAPFVSKKSIEAGLDAVLNQGYDSAFSVVRIQDFLWENEKPLNYSLEKIPRTQDISPIFKETSGFYIYRSEVLNQLGRRIGINPKMIEIGEIEGIDIDEEEDFMIADALNYYDMKAKKILGGGRKTYNLKASRTNSSVLLEVA